MASPLGMGFEAVCAALIDGKVPLAPARVTADLAEWFETPKTYLDRASALTLAASRLARDHAGWADGAVSPDRSGIALGTAYGCPESMVRFWQSVEEKGPRLANPLFFTHSYPNTPASMESIEHSLAGPHLTFCQGAASGALAAASALDILRLGRAERMLAGGFEALSPAGSEPDTGMPEGEGAAFLALEPGHDDNRQALACLAGAGIASFCRPAVTTREPDSDQDRPAYRRSGLFRWQPPNETEVRRAVTESMSRALVDAGVRPEEVSMVLMGTPSDADDEGLAAVEMRAIVDLFGGDHSVCPTCTAVGDRFGAAAGPSSIYGVIAALVGIREEWIIETAAPLPRVEGILIAREPVERQVAAALVNSIDLCGACVSLVISRRDRSLQ